MSNLIVTIFYKFIEIKEPEQFKKEHLAYCLSLGIKGRIYVGKEGINGTVSGTKKEIKQYKEYLEKQLQTEIDFKDDPVTKHPFTKMHVRVKEEIVVLEKDIDVQKTAPKISAKEFKQLLDKNADIIILDTRNDYETKIGKFKNAITINIHNFRDFPQALAELEKYKKKKIITYCTGGIRCEKATVIMKNAGFIDVHQLDGGIIKYNHQYPNTYFQGRCFVFDSRLSVKMGEDIYSCENCNKKEGNYTNCRNLDCDKLVFYCNTCFETMDSFCSKECKQSKKVRKIERIIY